jgi:hypothetical protein
VDGQHQRTGRLAEDHAIELCGFASPLVAIALVSGCSSAPSSSPSSALSCEGAITTAPLPEWARSGFTPPDQAVQQVHGVDGLILGVVFGDPSRAPAEGGHGSKILWRATPSDVKPSDRTPSPAPGNPDLRIHASLNGSDVVVDQVVAGGPGPSIVEVPQPGCWTLTLTWFGRTDRLAVPFA